MIFVGRGEIAQLSVLFSSLQTGDLCEDNDSAGYTKRQKVQSFGDRSRRLIQS